MSGLASRWKLPGREGIGGSRMPRMDEGSWRSSAPKSVNSKGIIYFNGRKEIEPGIYS